MTVGNYLENNQLAAKYGSSLVILGFPCPQFLNQEPGHNDEILNCLKYVRPGSGYVPNFILFQKILVNGEPSMIHPVYNYLRASCPQPSFENLVEVIPYISWSPVAEVDITWNFEKFLIDRRGVPYKRYVPQAFPLTLMTDINYLLAN